MKIVHVVTLIARDGAFGGPLRVALNQVQELRARGHAVELVACWCGKLPAPFEVDGIPVRAFRAHQYVPGAGFSGLYSPGLQRWLKNNLSTADVLHVHAGRDLISLGALVRARAASCPTVVQTHGMIGLDRRLRARVLDRLAVRRLVGRARRHLVLTKQEESELPHVLRRHALRTYRIRNGVTSRPPRTYALREPVNVLFCARLQERKRPVAFVEMAGLVGEASPATFSIVGPDEGELLRVQSRIAELDVGTKVKYEGALPYDRVLTRMEQATIYVLPSVDEPFPMTLLEAMSIGLACICTDSCGISDDVRRAGAAIVTDGTPEKMAEAVSELLRNAEQRTRIGERAQAMISEQFSIAAVVDSLEAMYESVLSEYDHPAAA